MEDMRMFCPNCGTESRDDATYCPECGGAINEPTPKPAEPARPASDYGRPSDQIAAAGQYHQHSPHGPQYSGPGVPGYGAPIPHVPDYLVPSILLTICCCPPGGAFALLYSAFAKTKLEYGDIEGAKQDSAKARNALIISVVLYVIFIALYFILIASMVSSGAGTFGQFGDQMQRFERF